MRHEMGVRRRWIVLCALASVGVPLTLTTALGRSAVPFGALTGPSGRGACIAEPGRFPPLPRIRGCANNGRALEDAGAIALSPDGRSVYVAATQPRANGIAAFSRDSGRRGALRQLPGTRGCVVSGPPALPIAGCTNNQRAILTPNELVVSPDGRHLYSASANSNALAVFARNRSSGVLTQLAGLQGCVSQGPPFAVTGCAVGRALGDAISVAVSPDGRSVYTATFFGISVFARNRASGALTQLPGREGCLIAGQPGDVVPGCAIIGEVVDTGSSVTVSPDGRFVYATATGDPSQGAVTVFSRNRRTGAIRRLRGRRGCIVNQGRPTIRGCAVARAIRQPQAIVVSPDGGSAYVIAGNGFAVFSRNRRTGALRQLPGRRGCLVDRTARPIRRCDNTVTAIASTAIAISRDGANAYVASGQSNAVSVFARNRRTGALHQLPGRFGCLVDRGGPRIRRCRNGVRALNFASDLAVARDGANVYVTSQNAVAALVRNRRR